MINWRNIRVHNNSQNNAFEELVCQFARRANISNSKLFSRLGTPDGGVECFWEMVDGKEIGWQAKYVFTIDDLISQADMPYSDIPKLPDLLSQFRDAYMAVLTQMEAPIFKAIEDAKVRVFEVLNTKKYKDELNDRYFKLFREIHDKATTCNNVATLQNVKIEADALKVRLLNEMAKKDEKIAEDTPPYGNDGGDPKPIKKQKSISIKNVSLTSSWQIESAQDLDKYISELREQIMKELDQDTIINIEF